MSKRTREKQLAKLAARRAAERRRRRRNKAIATGLAVLLVLGAGGAVAWTLIRDEPGRDDEAQGNDEQEPAETVACGAEVPPSAGQQVREYARPPKPRLEEGADFRATLVTSCGRIVLDLYEDQTPVTVNNFVFLAEEGFYDGVTFHRVVADFVIQAGDPTGTGSGGPGYTFEDEIVKSLRFNRPGLLAMANPGSPDSNGSQFFITVDEPTHLNGKHTIFGEVTDGMNVVRQINRLPVGANDLPEETVYIERVTVRPG
jgi:cyclophilin family peptidyl-prolyl cis-trans isomerase